MKRLLALFAALPIFAAAQLSPFAQFAQSTVNVAVTGTAQNLTIATAEVSARQVVFTNVGTQTVFFRCDGVTATSSNAMPLLSNSQVVLTIPGPQTTCSAIASTTGSTMYATVGSGQ